MRTYLLAPVRAALPALSGREFDPAREPFCLEREYAPIDQFVWDESGYCPEARAYVGWEDDGFSALLCAKEREIAATVTEFNGRVCCDSCLEWFFKPFADDPRYLNIEVNPRGVALIGFGASRAERSNLPSLPEGMDIRASEHRGGWWAVACRARRWPETSTSATSRSTRTSAVGTPSSGRSRTFTARSASARSAGRA